MAIGQSSPYASPLSYSSPMTSTPSLADIRAVMDGPKASAAPQASSLGLEDLGNVLGSFQRPQSQPLQFLETPSYQQYQRTGPTNLLDLISNNYVQEVMQAPQAATMTLLDYIRLLGGM